MIKMMKWALTDCDSFLVGICAVTLVLATIFAWVFVCITIGFVNSPAGIAMFLLPPLLIVVSAYNKRNDE